MINLAQLPIPVETVNSLADKDFKWWFTAVFIILLASGLAVFKMLITQNSEQRKAHADMTDKLMLYLTQDHAKAVTTVEMAVQAMSKLGMVLDQSTQVLTRVATILDKHQT